MKTIRFALVSLSVFGCLTSGISLGLSQPVQPCGVKNATPEEMQLVREYIQARGQAGHSGPRESLTFIGVFFHVIRLDDGSNDVTDQQLIRQLYALNNGFSNTIFRFVLHDVERVNNTAWSTHSQDSPEEIAMKQALAVDPTHVLNFYICTTDGSLSGYASFPWYYAEDSFRHGVVVHYNTLPGGTDEYYFGGLVGVHEVGHYFGLWHTFQEGCLVPGDEVDDTPYEQNANLPWAGCNQQRDTCPLDPGFDPVRNFMDYSNDNCRNHFTAGQARRMGSVTAALRPSLFLTTPVSIDQKLEDGTRLTNSSIALWHRYSHFKDFSPGHQFVFPLDSTKVLRGLQEVAGSPLGKYNQWTINEATNDPDVRNHHEFAITSDLAVLTSQFKQTTSTITIKTDLLDAPGTTGGNFQFRDPWYIDYPDPQYGNNWRNRGMQEARFLTRSLTGQFAQGWKPDFTTTYPESPNHPYRGVFLNENPNWLPDRPNYSVGAPAVNYINGIESYFVKWDGNPADVAYQNANAQQTGVVFKNSGAMAVVKYKGHRLSSSAEATSSPNQRKLTQVGSVVHKIYEGSGEIWYSISADGGATWNPEFRVSDGTGGHSAPSIASGNAQGLPEVYVVYRKQAGTTYQIKARLQLSGNWQSQTDVSDVEDPIPLAINPRPAIGRYDDAGIRKVLVLWEGANALMRREASSVQNNPWQWGYITIHVPSTEVRTPSLANSPDGAFPADVVAAYGEIWKDYGGWQVSEDPSLVNNRLPSAAMDAAGRLHMAWVAFDKSRDMDVVVHRSFQYGEGSPHYIIIDDFGMPVNLQASVTAHADASNGGVSVFWNDGDIPGVFDNFSYDGINFAGWTYTSFGGATNHVNAAAYANPTRLTFLATKGSTAPYAIAAASHDDAESGMEEEMSITESRASKHSRRAFFRDTLTNAAISLEYGDMMLLNGQDTSGQRVAFVPVAGNLREKFLRTEAFRPEQRMRLKLKARVEANKLPRDISVVVNVIDSASGNVLASYTAGNVPKGNKSVITKSINEALPATSGAVYCELRIAGLDVSRYRAGFSHIEEIQRSGSPASLPKTAAQSTPAPTLQHIPDAFALHPNHPNPFNPSTTIKYDLPEQAHVSLTIYDVLGREVATLVDQVEGAGFKSVNFDASRLSSGVYLARFTATDGSGNVKLAKVMKLVLAK